MAVNIQVSCENLGGKIEVEMGTSLLELTKRLPKGTYPYLAAMVNNRIKELNFRIYTPCTIQFVDITSFEGIRVYQRTLWFLLQKAVQDLYPHKQLHIRHSVGESGFYCEVDGKSEFSAQDISQLKERIHALVKADYSITKHTALTSEVRARYAEQGFEDKIALLDTRPRLYSTVYTLDNTVGYFYGSLAPSTGYITHFDIEPFFEGFYLALPLREDPTRLKKNVKHGLMVDIFREYQSWVNLMGMPTVGALNANTLEGNAKGMILLAEAFHERKFAMIADRIQEAHQKNGTRVVLISGPSSSGKTTSAKRLAVQLGVVGFRPELISLDDYFVNREETPKDENGAYDYEVLEALDLKLFNSHLERLLRGESVDIPRYDFITGRRTWHNDPLKMDDRSILIIEGIHGLNPRLTTHIPESQKFKIYVSCFTSVAMDNINRISTSDNRLLRRLTRDYSQRGSDALSTLSRWASVRRGEERHIFPYQENADVMLNSSLFYEISVLRPYAAKILREVPDTVPEYNEARRLLKFLDNFSPIPHDCVPPTSILREFIGGSNFTY